MSEKGLVMEYRDEPTEFREPTEAELRARSQRNFAIAGGLLAFMAVVFLVMVARAGAL